ncbi:hypothetical protein B0H10DRAFT_2122898, partial [Mycena sp. CBHHK59/15]
MPALSATSARSCARERARVRGAPRLCPVCKLVDLAGPRAHGFGCLCRCLQVHFVLLC